MSFEENNIDIIFSFMGDLTDFEVDEKAENYSLDNGSFIDYDMDDGNIIIEYQIKDTKENEYPLLEGVSYVKSFKRLEEIIIEKYSSYEGYIYIFKCIDEEI